MNFKKEVFLLSIFVVISLGTWVQVGRILSVPSASFLTAETLRQRSDVPGLEEAFQSPSTGLRESIPEISSGMEEPSGPRRSGWSGWVAQQVALSPETAFQPDPDRAWKAIQKYHEMVLRGSVQEEIPTEKEVAYAIWRSFARALNGLAPQSLAEHTQLLNTGQREKVPPELLLESLEREPDLPNQVQAWLEAGRAYGNEVEFYVVDVFGVPVPFAGIGDEGNVDGLLGLIMGSLLWHQPMVHVHYQRRVLPSLRDFESKNDIYLQRAFIWSSWGWAEYSVLAIAVQLSETVLLEWEDGLGGTGSQTFSLPQSPIEVGLNGEGVRELVQVIEERLKTSERVTYTDTAGYRVVFHPRWTVHDFWRESGLGALSGLEESAKQDVETYL